jgi:tetratricopeptide (TPR) repeat protein
MAKAVAALFTLALASAAAAQDADPAELKKRILEKVREKLAAERAAILKRVEKIIDEELAKEGPGPAAKPAPAPADDAKVRELERKLKAIEEQKEILETEVAKAKRLAADEAIKKEAKKDGPHDEQEAQDMFDEALELHDKKKDYDKSVRLFKKVYYQFPKDPVGFTSAYNVACGYALAGKKEEALDWLEIALAAGFKKIDHLRKDPDLDSLRNEKRYKRLLTDR